MKSLSFDKLVNLSLVTGQMSHQLLLPDGSRATMAAPSHLQPRMDQPSKDEPAAVKRGTLLQRGVEKRLQKNKNIINLKKKEFLFIIPYSLSLHLQHLIEKKKCSR